MDSLRESLAPIIQSLFAVDSIWSVVLRGLIWFGIAMVIIISADAANPDKSLRNMKSNLGFFLIFLILSGILVYTLFGFTSTAGPATS